MRRVLLVDGYNMIGDWPELKALQMKDLENARDVLIEKMAEYQAFTGMEVIIIFDAHMVPGLGKKYKNYRLSIIYTREKETADERIEKLVKELKRVDTQIYVATSDFVEQRVIFASGAFRKSARELRNEVLSIEKGIEKEVSKTREKKVKTKLPITDEMAELFEKWRRGKG
ncbi:putative RNA-binding protein with PIN domain [Evansella vedderi]|uniref:RNA-binding protein with PIN domain n=1 Tax=Evansella vedderi TaxID=38282 RepID=A0ABT9ZZ19_9BACI|nr:NYN domain-containing protein [Evansella vedderi]MDQ0255987.1 putative RNA-binding protein with PIN domain [Evansella vedderi]